LWSITRAQWPRKRRGKALDDATIAGIESFFGGGLNARIGRSTGAQLLEGGKVLAAYFMAQSTFEGQDQKYREAVIPLS
jgi:hypothetical protein